MQAVIHVGVSQRQYLNLKHIPAKTPPGQKAVGRPHRWLAGPGAKQSLCITLLPAPCTVWRNVPGQRSLAIGETLMESLLLKSGSLMIQALQEKACCNKVVIQDRFL